MKINKLIQFIILLFLLFFLVSSVYNYFINHFLIKTEILHEETLLQGQETHGYIFKKESLVYAPENGSYNFLVKEGQRVGKNHEIAKGVSNKILSPTSGIISFTYDNCELIGDPFERTDFNFENIKAGYQETSNIGRQDFQKGDVLLKIVDNLEKPWIYLEVPLEIFEEPLQTGDILQVTFPANEVIYKLKIIKLKGLGRNAIILLEFLNLPDEYSRIQELKIISDQIKAVRVPKKSVVSQDDRFGVYAVEKGFVIFKDLDVLGEEENDYITSSIKPLTEIILNPKFAREGKYIR